MEWVSSFGIPLSPSSVDGVYCVWNVMAHAQKSYFFFRRNGRVHLNRRGASVESTTGSRGVRISGSNAGYIMFRSSVKSTGYRLRSPVSSSLPLPCVTVCHHISTGLLLHLSVLRTKKYIPFVYCPSVKRNPSWRCGDVTEALNLLCDHCSELLARVGDEDRYLDAVVFCNEE
jgi:hypothetical protein